MEFQVKFTKASLSASGEPIAGGYGRAIYIYDKEIGTSDIQNFELDIATCRSTIKGLASASVLVTVPAETAFELDCFKDKNIVQVGVSEGLLEQLALVRKDQDGNLEYYLQDNDLLAFWASNGYAKVILSDKDRKDMERKKEEHRKDEERLEKRRKAQEEEAANKDKIKPEKEAWIKEFGSEYLKDCLELGYSANKEYVKERAENEFPGYLVDYDDSCFWESRRSPSPDAIQEVKQLKQQGVDAEVVWMTRYPKGYADYDYDPCECIVIHNFLGKYDLVKW